jgi:glycosyltransferase involved in cell wall biosynthesis
MITKPDDRPTPGDLVTCLCPTRNRRHFLPYAIDCFLKQSYYHREMLIVADGEPISDLIPNDSRIRVIKTIHPISLGEKRNFGCRYSHGRFIAHWDDDDFYGPERLTDQIHTLCTSKENVTGYHTLSFTDGNKTWLWKLDQSSNMDCFGCSLVYTKDYWKLHQFKPLQLGEDREFILEAQQNSQLTITDGTRHVCCRNHENNTLNRDFMKTWKTGVVHTEGMPEDIVRAMGQRYRND